MKHEGENLLHYLYLQMGEAYYKKKHSLENHVQQGSVKKIFLVEYEVY